MDILTFDEWKEKYASKNKEQIKEMLACCHPDIDDEMERLLQSDYDWYVEEVYKTNATGEYEAIKS